jgi:hypothetical protein
MSPGSRIFAGHHGQCHPIRVPERPRWRLNYRAWKSALTRQPLRLGRADSGQLGETEEQALDVALTLCDNLADQATQHETSEDWSVPRPDPNLRGTQSLEQ